MVPNFPSRLLHDLGLAAWFGGTLANAVALNRAAGQVSDPSSAGRVANTGWDAWTPINAVAIGATIVGSVGQLLGNKERLATQSGVASMSSSLSSVRQRSRVHSLLATSTAAEESSAAAVRRFIAD